MGEFWDDLRSVGYRTLDFDRGLTIPRRLEQLAADEPERVCMMHAGEQCTFRELNERANQLARYLAGAYTVANGAIVALVMQRSVRLVQTILALWKCGAAYLPIPPEMPLSAMQRTIRASGVSLVLYDELPAEQVSALGAMVRLVRVDASCSAGEDSGSVGKVGDVGGGGSGSVASELAYVLYTSGSTGTPKGAMVEHLGMLNHLHAKIADLGLSPDSVVAQTAPLSFDISVWQMFGALFAGGRIAIYDVALQLDARRFTERLVEDRVTVLEVVPSYLESLLDAWQGWEPMPRFEALEYLIVTGETASPALANRWLRAFPTVPLMNAYGPTEASDDVTHHVMTSTIEAQTVPLGRPIPNVRIYVLDEAGGLCGPNIKGEICVSGICVGRGYLNDPEQTARVFVADPFVPGERMYRTGDIGFWNGDGILEFVGRLDEQVKIRGHRIEIGEIEACLERCPEVRKVAVVASGEAHEKRLEAYVVLAPGGLLANCEKFVRQHLSEAMVPAHFVELDRLPLTPNGKLDRTALRQRVSSATRRAPQTPTEQAVLDIFAQVLGMRELGTDDDFFRSGGNSLAAMRVLTAIHQKLGVEVPMWALLEARTVTAVSVVVDSLRDAHAGAASPQAGRELYSV